ncbi:hypothetical protein TKK_0012482 [Trichogramma kaykai]
MKTRPRRNLGELPNRHNGGPRKTTRNLILSPTQTNLHVPAQEVSADEDVLVHQRIVQNQTKAKKRRAVIDKVVAARAFLASLKECQESNEIPTDRLLEAMPVVLKDKAKRWYRENKHRWTTWASFRKAFENKYMKLLRDSEVRRDLDRRTQAKGETIFDFADCFRYLVRHLRRKPEETELVEMFLRNLRSEYRRHIVAARPWTIDEAVELGQELEQMLEDDERFEEPPPKSKMNLADAGVQTKKTVKIAAIEEVANSSVSDGPQKGNKTPAKKQTAKQQQKVPQSNKTKAEKATKTSKAKDSAEETPNSEPVTSYELSPNPWHYPAYDEWQAHAMSAMQYAPAVAMPTMPPWPTWPPRPMYQAPWPPAPPEQGRGQMAWNNLVRPPVQASANAGNDSPGIDRPKGKFSGPCFNCQTPGHHAANCPHKICTICKQNGHGQNACPNKPIAPPPNAGSQACTEKCQMCGQAGFTVLTCPQCMPLITAVGNARSGLLGGPQQPQ